MKPDLYTKTVLTVIVVALVWLGVRPLLMPPGAGAQGTMRVIVERVEPTVRVRIEEEAVKGASQIGGVSSIGDVPRMRTWGKW